MIKKLGKFQHQEFQGWKGLTKENHLAESGLISPVKLPGLMLQLRAYQNGASLESLLSKYPTKEFDSYDEYSWDVVGSVRRNIPLVEARDENGTVVTSNSNMVGANTAPFYLVFGEDWFGDGEVIVGNLNQVYTFRILGDARMEGDLAVYKVELMGGNTAGVPADRLLAGEKFSVEYAPVEHELSRKAGTVRHATPISMRNEWSTVRIYHKVPGTMLNRKIAVGIPMIASDDTGKVIKKTENMWMLHEEWAVEQQFGEYKNNLLAFGVSNRNSNGEYMNIGKSGNVIRMGDGLYAQMEAANTYHYSKFSLKLLESVLYELLKGCRPEDRNVVIRTGMWGALQFHKEVTKDVSGWTQFSLDNLGVVRKTSSKDHPNALAAGFKFTEWVSPMGFKVTVEIDNWYDDEVRNKIMHSSGNGLAQSYRMDIMDMGPKEDPNIFKCSIKGMPEMTGFQWGPFANPFTGQTNNQYASYDEDSATIHKKATLGICLLDPTRTISLIPVELQGYN